MSETWAITEEGTVMIKQHAVFDLEQLYKTIHSFAEEYKYFFNEKNFTKKDKSDGMEFQIEWALERKVTPFIKFKIDVEIWSLRTTKEDHNKYKGELEMNFDANMEMDWQKNWESNTFTKFLRNTYIYYLKKQYFLNYAGKCWEETYDLHSRVKTILHQFSLF
jgi:hypothetical protein